jgi:hypothetical protein
VARYILHSPGLASCRSGPVSSNVMPHQMPTRLQRKASFSIFGARKTTLPTVQRSVMKAPTSGSQSSALPQAEESKLPTAKGLPSSEETPVVPRSRTTGKTTGIQASRARRASLSEPLGSWRGPQRRSTAPALPSAETGWRLWPVTRNTCRVSRARHNPSLNHRTRYGRPPGPVRGALHSPRPGPGVLPHRAG